MFFDPDAVCLDECVRHFKKFAHEDDDGEFGGFSCLSKCMVLFFQIGIEPHRDERGHVKCVSQGLAATADERLSLSLTGFAAVRDQTGEASGLLAFKRANLRQEREEQGYGNGTEAGD